MVLSYRHGFHAGNFADVVKHSVVSLILSHFHRKPRAFYFLDTHAGGPLYNLARDAAALKTLESAAGIGRVWHRQDYPAEMEPYLSAVRNLNGIFPGAQRSSIASYAGPVAPTSTGATPAAERTRREFAWHHLLHALGRSPLTDGLPHFAGAYPASAFAPESLALYPGSSLLGAYFQRQVPIRAPGLTEFEGIADRAVATELHTRECEGLKAFFAASKTNDGGNAAAGEQQQQSQQQPQQHVLSLATRSRIQVLHQSGFSALTSTNSNLFLAPKQGRGLVLIDPPYETASEQAELLSALPKAYQRFPHGVFALWYPLIDYSPGSPKKLDSVLLKALLKRMRIPKMLCVEFSLEDSVRAARSGISPAQAAAAERRLPSLDDDASAGASKYQPERQRGLGMTGTGLILINPPFGLESQVQHLCSWLATALPVPVRVAGESQPQIFPARFEVSWLTPERIPKEETARAIAEVVKSNAANAAAGSAAKAFTTVLSAGTPTAST